MAKRRRSASFSTTSSSRWRIFAVLMGAALLIAASQQMRVWEGKEGPPLCLYVQWAPVTARPELYWRPLQTSPGFKQIGGGVVLDENGQRIRHAVGWRTAGGEKEELARMHLTPLPDGRCRLMVDSRFPVELGAEEDGATPEYRLVDPPDSLPAELPPGRHEILLERAP